MGRPRQLHDSYFRKAKAEGYLARSAYKLIEIDDRTRILRRARKVIDLGCAPGSWLQVADKRCPEGVHIVGIDLKEVDAPMPDTVRTVVGDVTKLDPADLPDPGPFDVVLSDMAPNTSGRGDDLRSAILCRQVLDLLPILLAPGESLVMKILEGAETPGVLAETRAIFGKAQQFKPRACREMSRETYIIGLRYRGGR
jgi:23S rRNA (uridine2552-2'-O)-methyltransferase